MFVFSFQERETREALSQDYGDSGHEHWEELHEQAQEAAQRRGHLTVGECFGNLTVGEFWKRFVSV